MGMNYYVRKKSTYPSDDCNYKHNDNVQELTNGYVFNNTYYSTLEDLNKVYYREYHIGKNSYGWHFLLATYPNENINNLNDWKNLFKNNQIYDEENTLISTETMIDIITNKPKVANYTFKCIKPIGKRNLFKHIDKKIIDNDTDGTYDIIDGYDFS